ncbi:tyrosine-type recombinase/integrase [Vibrio astriarenae]
MRYLTLSKQGIWTFRFQIPSHHRALFDNRHEIKQSLKTSCKTKAQLSALQLELEIRNKIAESASIPTQLTAKLPSRRKLNSKNCPFKCLLKYKEYKSSYVSEKTIEGASAKCHLILKLANKKTLSSIRRSDAELIRTQLFKLPANINKHKQFESLTPTEAIELNQELNLPVLSESSVKDYMQKCSSFFEWCVLMEYTDINPFKGFRFKNTSKVSSAKKAYTKTQLAQIFSTEIYTHRSYKHSYQYWLPLLARYSGARINELCQLYKEDIQKIDGIWCLSINKNTPDKRLKNPNAQRLVPIHSELIKLGFLSHVKSLDTKRVFPELNLERDGYATTASKWYARHKTKLGFCKGFDFHSFRHTFANELKNLLVPSLVTAEILGHSQNNITYDRYGKELNIKTKREAIELIEAPSKV